MSKVVPFPGALPDKEELSYQGTITIEVYEDQYGEPLLKIDSSFDTPSSYMVLKIASQFFEE